MLRETAGPALEARGAPVDELDRALRLDRRLRDDARCAITPVPPLSFAAEERQLTRKDGAALLSKESNTSADVIGRHRGVHILWQVLDF